ncbi:hypothetical protein BST95_08610 [Halioglobus japonicus]|uniref:General secretion pathway protein GspK n=1 Tax=Halioglobus japonicus TaxID=930805 RepID=A0AAP8SN56_9GAMM|nr:type II secretion system protein GspK [Halioglobus japonicus]AQA18282.1 hypothetical protein BST95_08610 [Halioglobus japonicus]PLW86295.1 general secretion pathway protein GspK [Halioglobus japonicus]GHD13558.1 hypothetical protein GCM10007052_15960 [Halioglobus japonicus]
MKRQQAGVALALVVWFLAGMSLLVAGIVSIARVDAGMTQLHLARAKAVAVGDGAISLAMVELTQNRTGSAMQPVVTQSSHSLGDVQVKVQLIPSNGLVNLNNAPDKILAGLFAIGGAIDPGDAQILADNVVKWRKPKVTGRNLRVASAKRFYAPEDLLRVDGVTRGLLDSIRDYVVVGPWASGGIDWNSSPEAIMGLLDDVNPGRAKMLRDRRENLARTDGANAGLRRGGGVDSYRADALVEYGGRTWLRRRWISMTPGNKSALPWRVVRTEPPRVVEAGIRDRE